MVGGFGRGDDFDDTVAAIMLEPGAQVAQLSGEGGGTIRIAWSGERAAVIGDGLPVPLDGSVYELWLIDDAGPHSAGVVDRPSHTLAIPDRDAQVAPTTEPAGGSAQRRRRLPA